MSKGPTPAPWSVYRCPSASDGEACGIRGPANPAFAYQVRNGYSDVVSDTNRDECHHMMTMEDAELIVSLRNYRASEMCEHCVCHLDHGPRCQCTNNE